MGENGEKTSLGDGFESFLNDCSIIVIPIHHVFTAPRSPLVFNRKIAPEMLLPPVGNSYTLYTPPAVGVSSAFNPVLPTPPIDSFQQPCAPTLPMPSASTGPLTSPVRPFPSCLPPLPPPVLNNQLLIPPSMLQAQLAADTWCRASASNPYANPNQNQQNVSPYMTANPTVPQPDYTGYMHRFIDNYRDTGMADSTFHWLNDTYHQCRGPMMNAVGRLVLHA